MRNAITSLGTFALAAFLAVEAAAQNPIVQTWYTSDPAPLACGDKLYVYTGHDEDGADFFWMYDWRVYSTTDMVNWTDHGTLLSLESFAWADDRAWAAQCIERDGHYFWYICAHSKLSGGMAIGVAVADSPTGPFRDALGKPLFDNGQWDNIDPTVMIDDDGQAWLFWGNPAIHYARLNRDMVSFDGEVKVVKQTIEGFGSPDPKERQKDVKYKDCYTEGPWITKRGGNYQLLYAAGGVPEHIAYSTAPTPEGPWTYRGEIMPLEDTKSFTNHCGVVDFKGHSYFFYHTGKLPGGGGFGRSVAVDEFKYNADGSFPIIHHTDAGVEPIATLNPYTRQEAETIAWSKGVKTENSSITGVYVGDINNGDFIKVREVDFGQTAATAFTVSAASAQQGGTLEVHLDSLAGPTVATVSVPSTGGWEQWRRLRVKTEPVTGKHDVYFAFTGNKGAKLFTLDWWQFENGTTANASLQWPLTLPQAEFVMQLRVTLGESYAVGDTPHGRRQVIPITGGTFSGPHIQGSIIPGGADYQLATEGRTELEAIYSIKTDDGTVIHVRNRGLITNAPAPNGQPSNYFLTAPQFEAPSNSQYAWLNNAIFSCQPDFTTGFPGIVLNVWRINSMVG